MSAGAAFAVVLCAVAGLAGSIQIAVMGQFGARIGVFSALAFANAVAAAIGLLILVVTSRSLGGYADALRAPPWLWLGGVMAVIIVLTITVSEPRIGTTATIGILIAGQLAMGAAIDRFGLLGVEQIDLAWPRLLGIALVAVGAALSLYSTA